MNQLLSLAVLSLQAALVVAASPSTAAAQVCSPDYLPSVDHSIVDDHLIVYGQAAVSPDSVSKHSLDLDDQFEYLDDIAEPESFPISGMAAISQPSTINSTSVRSPGQLGLDDDLENELPEDFVEEDDDHNVDDEAPAHVAGLAVTTSGKQQASAPTAEKEIETMMDSDDDEEFDEDAEDEELDYADRDESDNQATDANVDGDAAAKTVTGQSVGTSSVVIEDVEVERANAHVAGEHVHGMAAVSSADVEQKSDEDAEEDSEDIEDGSADEEEDANAVRGMSAEDNADEEEFDSEVDSSIKGLSEAAEGNDEEEGSNGDDIETEVVKGMTADGEDAETDSFNEEDDAVKGFATSQDNTDNYEISEEDAQTVLSPELMKGMAAVEGAGDETDVSHESADDSVKGMASVPNVHSDDVEITDDGAEGDVLAESDKGLATDENKNDSDADSFADSEIAENDEIIDDEHDFIDDTEEAGNEAVGKDGQEVKGFSVVRPNVKATSDSFDASKSDVSSTVTDSSADTGSDNDAVTDHELADEDMTLGEDDDVEDDDAVKGMAVEKTASGNPTGDARAAEIEAIKNLLASDLTEKDVEEDVSDGDAESVRGMAAVDAAEKDLDEDAEDAESDVSDASERAEGDADNEFDEGEPEGIHGMAAVGDEEAALSDEILTEDSERDGQEDDFGDADEDLTKDDDDILAETARELEA